MSTYTANQQKLQIKDSSLKLNPTVRQTQIFKILLLNSKCRMKAMLPQYPHG